MSFRKRIPLADIDRPGRPPAVLSVDRLTAGYGDMIVLHDVSMQVGKGEIVCVLGINGAGKSTLLKAIVGVLPVMQGQVTLDGQAVTNWPSERLARAGIGYVPQYGDVFDTLTVGENLEMGGYLLKGPELARRMRAVHEHFPALARMPDRAAGKLSGGERKMVGVGRALMVEPTLLILDEPTAGLSEPIARRLLSEDVRRLADRGCSILIVEQRAEAALAASDWGYVMSGGQMRRDGATADLRSLGSVGALLLGER
jgi:ABC-type branched-subunit amino acid transport system ATPase component